MTKRRAVLLVLLGVSVVILIAALVWKPAEPVPTGPATDLKVIVLAVDGLDWFLLDKYMDEGTLPTIARIFRSAVTGEIEADRPVVPSVGWTMVARGVPLDEAETSMVESGGAARLYGVVPEVVRLVNQGGGDAVAIGWPAAWPLREDGIQVVAPYSPDAPDHPRTLAPALFDGAPGQATDPRLSEAVSRAVASNLETIDDEFAKKIHGGGQAGMDEALAGVQWGYLADRITLDVAGRTIAEREFDLALVYVGGLDAAMHRFLAPAMPDYFEDLNTSGGSYSDVVPNYFRFVDDAVARLLRLADKRTIFVLMSAYGTHPSLQTPPATGGHELGPPGVLLVRGPALAGKGTQLSVNTFDMAPTMLAALGLPIPLEMSGHVVLEMLPQGFAQEYPPALDERSWSPSRSEDEPPECEQMERLVTERLSVMRAGVSD